jgi:hypothetical protein
VKLIFLSAISPCEANALAMVNILGKCRLLCAD